MSRFLGLLLCLLFVASPAWSQCVDVNTADATGLDALPGIGPAKATAIVAYRDQNGPFLAVVDLIKVTGIGPATLESMRPMVCPIGAGGVAQPADASQVAAAASTAATAATTDKATSTCIDVNTADAAGLTAIPGIGASKAEAIIAYRNSMGPFISLNELTNVKGIGESTRDKMAPFLCPLSASDAPPASSGSADSGKTAAAATSGVRVNINTASAKDLQTLPGIGQTKADAIIDDRKANGNFASCEDLGRVSGIGPATVAQVKDACTVN